MNDQNDIARSAASALASKYGQQVQIELEKKIAQGENAGTSKYFGVAEAVSIAGFLLSVAQFIYQIYKDKKDASISAEDTKRKVQIEVKAPPQLSAEQRSEIIDAVISASKN